MTTDVAPPLAAGRLKLREILGQGGVGTVYLAYDERLDVQRAVKVLAADRASNQVQRQRFLTEARIQARLRHPNIVEVYDIEDEGGQVYLVMELVEGGSLWDRLKTEGPLPPDLAVSAAIGILCALEQAHALDIVHRDIKPHNILMTAQGIPKLADFGVAHLPSEEHEGVTRTGVVMGTWSFMAPEQRASSRRVDPRSDVYAVAATLYTLITGHTEPDLFDFEPDSEVLARLPEPLRPVMHRATRYSRSQRYQDARTLREDLERCLPALEGVEAAPWPTPGEPTDAPDAAHHLALGARAVPATTQDRPLDRSDPDPEARSGTLVPTPAEVERLLATSSKPRVGLTYSDDGHTVELQGTPLVLGEVAPALETPSSPEVGARHDTAEGAVPLPIHAEGAALDSADGLGWTIDDERQLRREAAEPEDDDEPVVAPWRRTGRRRFAIFVAAVILGSIGLVAKQQGWLPGTGPAEPSEPPAPIVGSTDPPPVKPDDPPPTDKPKPRPKPDSPTRPPPAEVPVTTEPPPAEEPVTTAPPPAEVPVTTKPPPAEEPVTTEPPPAEEPVTAAPTKVEPYPELPESTPADDVHRRVLLDHDGDIHACYREALQTNPNLKGPLEVRWGIEQGTVYSPAIKSTPDGHRDIGTCVTQAVSGWAYPLWFTDLPRFHTWNLDPFDETNAILGAKQQELKSCSDALPAEVIRAHGKGSLFFVLEDGWVKSVEIKEAFGDEALEACLLLQARGWRLPAFARGQFTMYLQFGY